MKTKFLKWLAEWLIDAIVRLPYTPQRSLLVDQRLLFIEGTVE